MQPGSDAVSKGVLQSGLGSLALWLPKLLSVATLRSDLPGFPRLFSRRNSRNSRTAGMFDIAPFRLTANLLKLGKVSEKALDMSNCFLFSFR